ncbi:DUF3158 family protein [Cupriavidus necator]
MPVQPTCFTALEQADFQRLEHAAYLKGLLQPFKGKGSLEALGQPVPGAARQLDRPGTAARAAPGEGLPLQPARCATGSANHWRRDDRPALAQY